MKDYASLKPLPLTITICIFLVFISFGAVASSEETDAPHVPTEAAEQETTPAFSQDTSSEKVDDPPAQTVAAQETTPAFPPDTGGENTSSFPWGGIGIGAGVVVILILYFVFGNMERKTASEFETTIIDDIVSAMKTEFALSEQDLRNLAADIVATRRCSDYRLAGLLRIEYEVEKTSSSQAKRTTAVAIKKENDFIVKKATRTLAWEDLPGTIRKEFILKNESALVYSLYSDSEKEG